MKNRLIMTAGTLALVALLAKVAVIPAVAQAVRALLVKNVDEKGRSPYMESLGRSCPSAAAVQACDITFTPVPAG